MLNEFKIGDIVKTNDNMFFQIKQIGYCGLALYSSSLIDGISVALRDEEVKKATFYELLDFIKENYLRLRITANLYGELFEDILDDYHHTLSILLSQDALKQRNLGLYYEYSVLGYNITLKYIFTTEDVIRREYKTIELDYDNIDFKKDYEEYKLKQELEKASKTFEDKYMDVFKKYLIDGEEVTVSDFVDKCVDEYIKSLNKPKKVIIEKGDKMSKISCKDLRDLMNKWFTNTCEPQDEVFVTTKNKTTVIKWKDGSVTKATCEDEDNFDIEKGIMIAMLKKYYTVEEIYEFIDKAKKAQELDLAKWRNRENKKVKETLKVELSKKEAKEVIEKIEKIKNKEYITADEYPKYKKALEDKIKEKEEELKKLEKEENSKKKKHNLDDILDEIDKVEKNKKDNINLNDLPF